MRRADDAAVLLLHAGKEAGHVFERDQRDVEAVAEADEARGLDAGVDVEDSGEKRGLVGDDADRAAAHAGEADDDVAGEVFVDLEEIAVVDDVLDDFLDVVGLRGIERDDGVEFGVGAVDRVGAGAPRRVVDVVRGQEAEQLANLARQSASSWAMKWATPETSLWVVAPPSLPW